MFASDGDSSDRICCISQCLTDYIAGDSNMDRGDKEESTISFEHCIFSEIHQLKPRYYRIYAIPGLILAVSQRAPLG